MGTLEGHWEAIEPDENGDIHYSLLNNGRLRATSTYVDGLSEGRTVWERWIEPLKLPTNEGAVIKVEWNEKYTWSDEYQILALVDGTFLGRDDTYEPDRLIKDIESFEVLFEGIKEES